METVTQLPLNLDPIKPHKLAAGATTEERFREFHKQNPHVYANLRGLALQAKRAGATKGGVKQLFEILRYSSLTTTGKEWKLNNIYTSWYARLLMEREPELAGFFEIRRLREGQQKGEH